MRRRVRRCVGRLRQREVLARDEAVSVEIELGEEARDATCVDLAPTRGVRSSEVGAQLGDLDVARYVALDEVEELVDALDGAAGAREPAGYLRAVLEAVADDLLRVRVRVGVRGQG